VRGPFQSVSLSVGQPREQRLVNGLADRIDSRAVFAQEKNCRLPHTSRLRFLKAPPLDRRLIGLKEGARSLQRILAPRPQDSVEHPLVIGIDYPAHKCVHRFRHVALIPEGRARAKNGECGRRVRSCSQHGRFQQRQRCDRFRLLQGGLERNARPDRVPDQVRLSESEVPHQGETAVGLPGHRYRLRGERTASITGSAIADQPVAACRRQLIGEGTEPIGQDPAVQEHDRLANTFHPVLQLDTPHRSVFVGDAKPAVVGLRDVFIQFHVCYTDMKMGKSQAASPRQYRMGKRAASATANGESILESARRLFGEIRYDQVTLDDVAAQAGVTERTVVRRFGSKEQLFGAVGAERAASIRRARDEVPAGDIPEAVRLLVGTYEDWGDEVLHLLSQERGLPGVTNRVEAGRRYHAAWVERAFSPLLVQLPPALRRRRLGQLVAVTDIYSWKVLRRDVGLSRAEVEASLRELIGDIVARSAK
jgi:AcrR family transcriptional regulator